MNTKPFKNQKTRVLEKKKTGKILKSKSKNRRNKETQHIASKRRIKNHATQQLVDTSKLERGEEQQPEYAVQKPGLHVQYQFTPLEQEKYQQRLQNLLDLRKEKSATSNKVVTATIKEDVPSASHEIIHSTVANPIAEYRESLRKQQELLTVVHESYMSQVMLLFLGVIFIAMFIMTLYNMYQTGFYFDFFAWLK